MRTFHTGDYSTKKPKYLWLLQVFVLRFYNYRPAWSGILLELRHQGDRENTECPYSLLAMTGMRGYVTKPSILDTRRDTLLLLLVQLHTPFWESCGQKFTVWTFSPVQKGLTRKYSIGHVNFYINNFKSPYTCNILRQSGLPVLYVQRI